ncbi:MAG TPA: hypothetical protein PLO51_02105, partial [Candidatus Micrarchaeota archaeon]|nr:hypothetical protein [Candidatus Micrarchaeota archaeon]
STTDPVENQPLTDIMTRKSNLKATSATPYGEHMNYLCPPEGSTPYELSAIKVGYKKKKM